MNACSAYCLLGYILNVYAIFLLKYLVIDDEDKSAASFDLPKNSKAWNQCALLFLCNMCLNNVKLFSFHINRKKKCKFLILKDLNKITLLTMHGQNSFFLLFLTRDIILAQNKLFYSIYNF